MTGNGPENPESSPPNCYVTGHPSLPDHRCACTNCQTWRRKCEERASRFRTPPVTDLVALLTTTDDRQSLVRRVATLEAEIAAACESLCCCPVGGDEGCGCRSATLPELIAAKLDGSKLGATVPAAEAWEEGG